MPTTFRRFLATAALALTTLATGAPAVSAQNAPTITAGDSVNVHFTRGDGSHGNGWCSVNSVTHSPSGPVALTAAHCLGGAVGTVHMVTDQAGRPLATGLNHTTRWAAPQNAPFHVPGTSDAGAFKLDPGVVAVTDQVHSTGIPGWLQADISALTGIPIPEVAFAPIPFDPNPVPLHEVRLGEPLCKDGGRTGRTCGPVINVNPAAGELTAMVVTAMGDSGGAGYVFRNGVARNVGVLSASKLGGITVFVAPERAHALIPR